MFQSQQEYLVAAAALSPSSVTTHHISIFFARSMRRRFTPLQKSHFTTQFPLIFYSNPLSREFLSLLSLSSMEPQQQQPEQRHLLTGGGDSPALCGPTTFTFPFAGGEGCAYSRAVLVVDMVWNLAFVVAAAGVLLFTLHERPSTPLRLWLCGYAFECLLHMAFVYSEYRSSTALDSFSRTPYR